MNSMHCPFCGEEDFDLFGLKSHLVEGDCKIYRKIEPLPRIFRTGEASGTATPDLREAVDMPDIETVRSLVVAAQKEKRTGGALWRDIDDIELTYLAIKQALKGEGG